MLQAVPPAFADCPIRTENKTDNYHVVQHRLLETFGRRESASPFTFMFNTEDHPLQHWLRLYAAPMRCAVETQDDTFLFITWNDRNHQTNTTWTMPLFKGFVIASVARNGRENWKIRVSEEVTWAR